MLSRVLIILCGLTIVMVSAQSFAGMPGEVTELEYSMVPPYCPLRMTIGTRNAAVEARESEYWAQLLGGGQNLGPIHHYCWALINLMRADKPPPPGSPSNWRQLTMEYAIGDIDYVIKNARPDFKLLPEIYKKRADVLVKLKRNPEAAADYRKAIQGKSDYWPAYAGLAEMYRNNKQPNEARAVVEEGLALIPDSRTLNGMLADLKKIGAKSMAPKEDAALTRASAKAPGQSTPETAPAQDPASKAETPPAK